eukprot:CAMPEP_0172439602 /NCGR_PEP_ID=MMETSP1065-20121228/531_1 /TAXON_ID=265537 /ORGANISM="Amphiprora paludosa, Strain CCMP125" /LENGTH=2621 /DNA_ID=CAMNT_0013188305 /DNA_START=60 /DNA_END=7928 /DNA_ORIENTATION=-
MGNEKGRKAMKNSIALQSLLVILLSATTARAEDAESSTWAVQDILLKFFEQTGGMGWTSSRGWLTEDVCQYEGVTCYGDDEQDYRRVGHVKGISLADRGLSGKVPSQLYELPYLQLLDLRQNDELEVDFSSIEKAQFLESLDISRTSTTSLEGLEKASSSLKELHMSDLEVNGPIPEQIYQLSVLESLVANNNGFTGSISSKIGDLFYLSELALKDNDLTSFIPTQVGKLVNLQSLNLANNPFRGDIPSDEIDKMVDLHSLDLSCDDTTDGTALTGVLPSLSGMRNIVKVDLSNHKISGSIPDNFLALASTDKPIVVDLSNNLISGSIPSRLSQKNRLDLYLADNQINQIDSSLCSASTNWLSGDVVQSGSCKGLLCPPGFYSPVQGRQTQGQVCQICSSSQFFGATTCGTTSNGGVNEHGILVAFFNAMGGRYWKTKTGWLNAEKDYCNWEGIICTGNSVTEINLSNNDMSGSPPTSLFDLPNLSVLDLSHNSIDFKFQGIRKATALTVLDLTQTDMSDLSNVGQLSSSNIRSLSLASNYFTGNLPNSIFNLVSLEELDISHNRFDGALSGLVGQMTKLQRLYIFGNKFSGQFPTQIGNLINLQELKASENSFGGTMPTEINNLSNLEHLSLRQATSSSSIGGSLPAFGNLARLTSLHLDGNALGGELPSGFLSGTTRASDTVELFLSNNRFTGAVPSSWATRFRKLNLDLTGNLLTSFGDGVCDQDGWMDGLVETYGCDAILCEKRHYNEFGRQTGPGSQCRDCNEVEVLGAKECGTAPITQQGKDIDILVEFFHETHGENWKIDSGWTTGADHCTWHGITCGPSGQVKIVSLENNGLTGTPPASVFDLEGLTELDLRNNEISFSFEGISNAVNLASLDLSSTHLDSVDGIQGASTLADLRLDDNDLKGPFPAEILSLKSLRRLSMNSNQIEGLLPKSISDMDFLIELFLVDNRFEGQIPAQLGGLSRLKILDLSGNNFDGTIPTDFNNLQEIETLALQRGGGAQGPEGTSLAGLGRGIYGPLPAFERLENLKQLFLGENSLSGTIPLNFLAGIEDKTGPVDVDISLNRLSGGLPASLARFETLNIDATGNRLNQEIPDGICRQGGWMKGKVALYGCDAILCPPGTSNQFGRRPNYRSTCEGCTSGKTTEYFGSFDCMTSEDQNEQDERKILEDFFRALDGERWVNHDGWLDPKISICEWHGIDCTSHSESVESIQLVQNSLKGTVPSSIYSMTNLVELDLGYNEIIMNFAGIQGANSLQFLNLDWTGLKTISGIQNSPSLMLLHLIGNDFGGNFPTEILAMPSLQVIYLSENDIGQTLPGALSSISQIAGFACKSCGLGGPIPASIGTWQQLEFLDLSDNHFTGEVPPSIGAISTLKFIDLSHQMTETSPGLSGNLPLFSQAKDLVEVHLQRNSFGGGIPTDFLSLVELDASSTDLYVVDLSFNQLTGVVPGEVARLSYADFYIAGNKISGVSNNLCGIGWNDFPSTTQNCENLLCKSGTYNGLGRATQSLPCEPCNSAAFYGSTFCIEGEREILMSIFNSLDGKSWKHDDGWGSDADFCTWYGVSCHGGSIRPGTVSSLDLSNNDLTGSLPDNIWLLTEATELDLSGNDIVVESFTKVGDASSLQTLKLSQNEVKSLAGISNANSLLNFHCTNCNIQGPFPEEILQLKLLTKLFLNFNKLSGPLPSNIHQLNRLKELHLVHNQLNETLPYQLGYLFWMENLSIGNNKFIGAIPTQFSNLPFLRVLSLENAKPENQPIFGVLDSGLYGDLPSFSRTKKLRQLSLSYNSIGGIIPSDFLADIDDKSETITVELTGNMIRHQIPAELAEFDDLRLFVGGNRIEGIAPEICAKTQWMDGLMAGGDCDALLCPPGSWNEFGRKTSYESCQICDHRSMSMFYGSTMCDAIFPENRPDRSILEDLYNNAGGDSWISKNNWMKGDSSICEWFGITCDPSAGAERVAEISLPSNNLQGQLASISFYLPLLRKLDLSGNGISVSFKDIKDSQSLEEIDLSDTHVVNLEGLGQANHLKYLKLNDNSFYGQPFPRELYDLTELRVLEIARTGFSGTILPDLKRLSNLETLVASGNELTGTIPDSFATLGKLQVLDLSNNHFYGPLPQSLERLKSLTTLLLGAREVPDTGLSGPMLSFAENTKLAYIDIGGNSLTGPVPSNLLANLATPTAPLTVLLDSNVVHGVLPASLSKFTSLNLTITDNEIEAIDPSLCVMSNWWGGELSGIGCDGLLCKAGYYNENGRQTSVDNPCKLCPGDTSGFMGSTQCASIAKAETKKILEKLYQATGGKNWKNKDGWFTNPDICNWFGITCKNKAFVETINLGSNNLVNTPPEEIFSIIGLKNLWLYSNPIAFSFEGIENAKTLENLQLDSTRVNSLEGVGLAPVLNYLDIRFNGMTGTLPAEIEELHYLETLLLSENKFYGPLPQFLGNRKLTILRASGNSFVGTLPSFSVHPLMKTLDVSNNELFGMIPGDLFQEVDPTRSLLLDLSGNKFSGVLPASLSRFSDLTIYARDNQFSGIDPALCAKSDWNGGSVGTYGCDAILCPPQTFSPSGRASVEMGDCEPCNLSQFFGHTECGGGERKSSAHHGPSGSLLAAFFMSLSAAILLLLN